MENNINAQLGGIILAAGLSSRMGEFKPLLEIDNRSMIGRVADMLRFAGAGQIFVVTGHRAAEIEAHLAGEDVRFIHNPRYAETQMLDSLLLGLDAAAAAHCKRVLFSPADVPLVQPETARALTAIDAPFVRPVFNGRGGHPVVLSCSLTERLHSYRGPGGLRGAMAAFGIDPVELAVDDQGTVMDSDTPEDFQRLLRYQSDSTV